MLGITALKDYRHVDDVQDILRSIIGDGSSPGHPVKPHVQTCLFRRAAAKGKPFWGDPDLSPSHRFTKCVRWRNKIPEKVVDLAFWEQKYFQVGRNPQALTTWRSNPFEAPHQIIGMVNSRRRAGRCWDTVVSRADGDGQSSEFSFLFPLSQRHLPFKVL